MFVLPVSRLRPHGQVWSVSLTATSVLKGCPRASDLANKLTGLLSGHGNDTIVHEIYVTDRCTWLEECRRL